MKKTLLKESIKEIKNTYKRFISILLMAFLGVGFFAGMRATSPNMIDTIDQYYKKSQIFDIQILSTLGLTEQDKKEMEKIEEIENVVGSFEIDGKLEIENKECITKIMCMEDINQPILLQGKLPERQEECVVEENFLKACQKEIGDEIDIQVDKVKNEKGEEIDYLKQNHLKIVGTVKSPLYISRDRGTSNLGSGKIDYFVYIAKENIKANQIYTTLYVVGKDTQRYKTGSKQYEEEIQKIKQEIESKKEERQQARHDELVEIATKKVEEVEETFQKEKQQAQEKIEKAQQEIEKGKAKIQEAERKMETGKKEADSKFANAYRQLQTAKKTIEQKEATGIEREQEAKKQLEILESQKQSLQEQLEMVTNTLSQLETQYQEIKENTSIPEEQKQALKIQIQTLEQNKQKIQTGITQLENGLVKGKEQLEEGKIQLQNAKKQLEEQEKQYEKEKKATESQLAKAKIELEKSKSELMIGEQELEKNKQEVEKKIKEAEEELQEAKEKVTEIENPKWYIFDRTGNNGYHSFIQDTESVENIARVFPIVFFLVAALISLTSMTRMVEEQRMQIGTLKALGYSKVQIASKYVIYASLACILGGILGMSVGFVLLPNIIWKMYQMMYNIGDQIVLNFDFTVGGMGLILISICIIGATIYSVLKELIYWPAVLMRPKAPKKGKRVFLEKLPFIWKHLSFSRKVTVRNIFRYKKRFMMTIIGILGCTSLILVGFGLRDSIQSIMPSQFGEVFQYDLQMAFKTDTEEREKQNLIQTLKEKKEIEKIVETYMTSTSILVGEKEEEVQMIVPKVTKELEGIIQVKDVKSKQLIEWKENEICLTDKVAELLEVKQGDTIVLKNGEEKEIEVKISNVVENYISHYIYMTKETYEKLYQTKYEPNVLLIKNKNLLEEERKDFDTELMKQKEVATVSRISTVMNLLDDTMKSLNYVVIILITSAGLLAFVVLYNLSNVNISERIRELATIKVLGFYDKEVYSYVTRETVILTAIGIGLGLLAGYFLNYFIIGTCEINMLRFKKIIEPWSYFYAILITLGFTMIVNLVTYFALKKIDMIESLKSVE